DWSVTGVQTCALPIFYLKLECLQPIRSFKMRGAYNAMAKLAETDPAALADGVWTASAGNMAQGVAFAARGLGVPCSVVVPETARSEGRRGGEGGRCGG